MPANSSPTSSPSHRRYRRRTATAAELTAAAFCGLAAFSVARQQRFHGRIEPSRDELAELQRELFAARVAVNRTGTNLNQAVAAFNATGEPPVWLEHAVALHRLSQAPPIGEYQYPNVTNFRVVGQA